MHEETPRGWLHIPQNHFISLLYFAMAIGLAVRPIHQMTRGLYADYGIPPAAAAWLVGTIFVVCGVLVWRFDPKGDWYTIAALPAIAWIGYTAISRLFLASESLASVVALAGLIYLIFRTLDMRMELENNKAVNRELGQQQVSTLRENTQLKAENEQLRAEMDALKTPLLDEVEAS